MSASLWLQSLGSFLVKLCGTISLISTITCMCIKTRRSHEALTADGLIDAFTHTHAGNWHPLTTISHMLDCQLYGLQAGWHHFTNVLLHTVAVLLLFLVLNQMTGAFGKALLSHRSSPFIRYTSNPSHGCRSGRMCSAPSFSCLR